MSLLQAVVLGIVQGLTEFFPVSSSGHLVLAESILGVNPRGVSFEVLVHLATLAAVLAVYWRRVVYLTLGIARRHDDALRYVGKLALASVPAGFVGVFAASRISELFDSPVLTAINLLITGLVVYSTRWLLDRGESLEPGWPGSLAVGVAQAAAILPGISRSGSTVVTALWARTRREHAAEFSFLLSVPAILGASVLELPSLAASRGEGEPMVLGAAALAAFVAGVAAILLFVRWLRFGRFHLFAYYCWGVGGVYLLYRLLSV